MIFAPFIVLIGFVTAWSAVTVYRNERLCRYIKDVSAKPETIALTDCLACEARELAILWRKGDQRSMAVCLNCGAEVNWELGKSKAVT